MNSEKLIDLVKQFRALEREQKDLDFRRAQWARTARGCFTDDRRFILWCKSQVGLTDAAAQDLCLQACAAGIVLDAKMWLKLGGMREIRSVTQLSTKREQLTVIETAKSTGRAIRTLVKERLPAKVDIMPTSTPRKLSDAGLLAKFIAENMHRLPTVPSEVMEVVRMYAPQAVAPERRKVA